MNESFRSQFDTPCLVVDEEIALANIRDMQKEAQQCGCELRPHIKTHKTAYFAKLQLEAGACGITSCKVSEAEKMADAGMDDIFLAYPLVGARKLARACALSKRIKRLILAVDNLDQARPLAAAAADHHCEMEVRIEVDCGGGRTGSEWEEFAPLVRFVEEAPGLRLTGLYTFRGLNGGIHEPAGAAEQEVELMTAYAQAAESICGRTLEISGGSTPTGREVARTGKVTEIRPGTYVFNDYMVHDECSTPLDRIAARLLVTVVSVHKDYVVIDGGCKTFPTDPLLDQPPYFFNSYAYFPDHPHLRLRKLTEEHGMVTAEGGPLDLKVGDILEAIPVHICPAVNLQNQIYIVNGDHIREEPIIGRGMLQ